MYRRGAIKLSMIALIEIVIAIIAIFILFSFGARILGINLTAVSQGEVVSFDALKENIPLLLESDSNKCSFKFYVADGSVFAGWSANEEKIERIDEGIFDSDPVLLRNQKCYIERSCVVMCNVGKGQFLDSNENSDAEDCQEDLYSVGPKLMLYEFPEKIKKISMVTDRGSNQPVMMFGADYKLINMLITKAEGEIIFQLSPPSLKGIDDCKLLKHVSIKEPEVKEEEPQAGK